MRTPSNTPPACLLLSDKPEELEVEIHRRSETPISVRACDSARQAVDSYQGEEVLFGRPDLAAQILPDLPGIRWVQSTWTGVEPLVAQQYRDYQLTVIKGVFGPQMSEYVYGYLLAHELKLLQRLEKQEERAWYEARSGSLQGKRIGVMGTGTIGAHIAATGQSLGLHTVGLNRSGSPVPGFDEVFTISEINGFLSGLDYVVSALPGTPGTSGLLNAETLARLPSDAYLVNVGRSNVIETEALLSALKEGRLAGATLDVFDEEPVPPDSQLWDTPGLMITAHIAAISHPSLIVPVFLDNYGRYCRGEPLKYVFDFEAGY